MKVTRLLAGLMVSGLLFACSSTHAPGDTDGNDDSVTLTAVPAPKLKMDQQAYNGSDDLKVNGETPYGKVGGKFKTLLKQTDKNDITRTVTEITREPGYRSSVHYMNYAVTTCVTKGEATMELDGKEPQYFTAGQCFIMPVGVKGYVANDGKGVLKMLDYNTFPAGEDTMVMLESSKH
ncbi:cupin domain-containing protein [Aquella oligotrophica]|uniref:Cupin domain-containing protein n=1 Tax=Aquella oligotrophica TaxID=2067065 RepID=A0A2I7N8S5_9NEIS|nr:hypothetical protein [Aquella oligotrophica]AUR52863.1 hypothetical protein CUN60_11340 [Aquella oligotrophica]